jgi:hypothetical protein
MSFDRKPALTNHTEAGLESELIGCLLADSTTNYPWNPADPEAAAYYIESDSNFSFDDWSDDEISQKSQSFFTQIQSCWSDSPLPESVANPLDLLLTAKFGARVPQQWLGSIAAKVSTMATNQLEPVDRLVQSVQDLLANWATEDLLVMARPYAYAMRCDPGVDNPDNIVRPLDWENLSELERAKLTILIAQYAIDHTPN